MSELEKFLAMFELFGQERRFKIMVELSRRPMSNGQLSALFEVPGIWPHLQKLEEVGLVIKHIYGPRDVKYRADPDALEQMSKFLSSLSVTATRNIPTEDEIVEELS